MKEVLENLSEERLREAREDFAGLVDSVQLNRLSGQIKTGSGHIERNADVVNLSSTYMIRQYESHIAAIDEELFRRTSQGGGGD